ncbi:hypothetical protein [Botryobacter ruber]|uniref:hypothetical protein n=1 Tax=Botryobacter ruber TaxID=2171629 RepID=UPI000F648A35|nr:hypothetical protein [Botryobacter ruber]
MKAKFALVALLFTCYSCRSVQQTQSNLFNFEEYKTISKPTTKQDSAIVFINLIHNKMFKEAEKIFPSMFKIDVSPFIRKGTDYSPYLGGVGEFALEYMNTFEMMALAVFLEHQYNTHNDVYDMLLSTSLDLDSTNVAAMFLLAKLRYEQDVKDDAYFLVQHMYRLEPENKEVSELYTFFEKNHKPLENNLPSFKEFINEEVHYRDFE